MSARHWGPSYLLDVPRADLEFGDIVYADPVQREVEMGETRLTPDQARELARVLVEAAALAETACTLDTLDALDVAAALGATS